MKLHHIGILSKDIERDARHLSQSCGYEIVSDIIEDKVQTVKVLFLKQKGDSSYIELVSPLEEISSGGKIAVALRKGIVLHHMCYQTDNIERDLKNYRDNGFFVLCEPVAASAFKGRKIAWVMDSFKNLFELVENSAEDVPLKV